MMMTGQKYEFEAVVFSLGDVFYAVRAAQAREILHPTTVTPIARSAPFIDGLMTLRGRTLAVVDMRKRFRLPAKSDRAVAKILVVRVPKALLGLVVDETRQVCKLVCEPAASAMALGAIGPAQRYVSGIAYKDGQLILCLDLAKLFSEQEQDEARSSTAF